MNRKDTLLIAGSIVLILTAYVLIDTTVIDNYSMFWHIRNRQIV